MAVRQSSLCGDIKTGEEKWKFKTGKANYLSPVVSEGVVYFGSDDEHLYALDRQTGEIKWKFKAENRVYSSPAISEGVVYFVVDTISIL